VLTLQQKQQQAVQSGGVSSEDKLVERHFCPDHVPRCTVLGCSDRAVCEVPIAADSAGTNTSFSIDDTTTAVIELEVSMREDYTQHILRVLVSLVVGASIPL
jgi:hypothetical protein